jgi:hypothetical protein
MIEQWKKTGELETTPRTVIQAATLSDCDNVVASTTVATVDAGKPCPQFELYCYVFVHCLFITPRAHAQQGKAIGLSVVCCLSSVDPKIAISQDLGTWATRKYNESIEPGEKLASVCFKSRDTIHECHK